MIKSTNPIKRLAGETLIYGLGSTLPRFLNYILTPFFTRIFVRSDFAVITEMYSIIALLFIILTYGMETSFFRFSSKATNKREVYSTAFTSILITSILAFLLIIPFTGGIANLLQYPQNPEYIIYIFIIVSIDAISAIPSAALREQNRPILFSVIRLVGVLTNIMMIFLFLWLLPLVYANNSHLPGASFFINPKNNLQFVFIANIIASFTSLALLSPQIVQSGIGIQKKLLKQMVLYALPITIISLSGSINEVADKLMLKYLLPNESLQDRMSLLGEYGANFKLAILMTVFIQMFRYAAEPFFFKNENDPDSKEVKAKIMKYFILCGWLIFLGVTLYIDILKYFISENYHNALGIVPIVLFAKLLQGISYNQSVWYKLSDNTLKGAYVALAGTFITISSNFLLVPIFGYYGAAYGQVACYASIVILSYFMSKKYYPINYPIKTIVAYSLLALLIYFVSQIIPYHNLITTLSINTLLILFFIGIIWIKEKNYFLNKTT